MLWKLIKRLTRSSDDRPPNVPDRLTTQPRRGGPSHGPRTRRHTTPRERQGEREGYRN